MTFYELNPPGIEFASYRRRLEINFQSKPPTVVEINK